MQEPDKNNSKNCSYLFLSGSTYLNLFSPILSGLCSEIFTWTRVSELRIQLYVTQNWLYIENIYLHLYVDPNADINAKASFFQTVKLLWQAFPTGYNEGRWLMSAVSTVLGSCVNSDAHSEDVLTSICCILNSLIPMYWNRDMLFSFNCTGLIRNKSISHWAVLLEVLEIWHIILTSALACTCFITVDSLTPWHLPQVTKGLTLNLPWVDSVVLFLHQAASVWPVHYSCRLYKRLHQLLYFENNSLLSDNLYFNKYIKNIFLTE